jgi:energy-coupling factor transporter ATP-binding protein EcfA2
MKLIINKFPPITQRCEIDLSKKLTLFVGQNNSGKTYLSQLIWGIYNKLSYIKSYNISSLEQISIDFTKYIKEYSKKEIFKKNIESDFKIIIEKKDIEYLNINPTFLPSSRLFLPSFYKYIFNTEKDFKDSMFQNFDKIDESNKKFYAPSYTQPVDDLIKKLIFSLDKPLKENIYLDKLSEIIEGNISVDRAEEIGMADISYNHKSGENIPMYLSSSMVNQLSTLYLYFKYWYQDNIVLIID